MRPAAKVAMSGICTALSVLLAVFRRCGAGAGLCMSHAHRGADGGAGAHLRLRHSVDHLCVYGALSFFLVPDKECMLMYVLFFGYYTIVRQWIGRLRPRSVALGAECLLFNAKHWRQ